MTTPTMKQPLTINIVTQPPTIDLSLIAKQTQNTAQKQGTIIKEQNAIKSQDNVDEEQIPTKSPSLLTELSLELTVEDYNKNITMEEINELERNKDMPMEKMGNKYH